MRKSSTKTYGFTGDFNESLIKQLEDLAKVKLEWHDSIYYWLYTGDGRDGEFRLYFNQDPMYDPESDPPEEYYFNFEYKECEVLLNVDGELEEVHKAISCINNIRLIESKIYEHE